MTAYQLAMTVSLGALDRMDDTEGCVAWIESADRRCGKPRTEGYLCARHHAVAVKRHAKQVEKERVQLEKRRAIAEAKRPERERRLAAVEAEIARRDPPPLTTDAAAFGGVGCTAVARQNQRRWSPGNVHRLAELWDERDQLLTRLGGRQVEREGVPDVGEVPRPDAE